MLAHFYTSKHAQNQHLQAFLSLTSKLFEVNKMQIYPNQSANPAQNYPQTNGGGLLLVCLLSIGAFLFYAVQSHLITEGFVYLMSNFFDSFSLKNSSIFADLALLVLFGLALFGLFCLFKFFFAVTVSVVIIAVLAAVFLSPETDQPHEVKIKSGEKFERVYGG